jgi:hypothetical protein
MNLPLPAQFPQRTCMPAFLPDGMVVFPVPLHLVQICSEVTNGLYQVPFYGCEAA